MGGLFISDGHEKNFWKRLWEVVSRFTWQLPQTYVGFTFSQVSNLAWQVDEVEYWGGATVLSGNFFGKSGALTSGSYVNGDRSLAADPNNPLFQHEYGHYLQSKQMGWAYLSRVGIPSMMGALYFNNGNHDFQPYEQDANHRAFLYFNENVDDFYQTEQEYEKNQENGIKKGWDFKINPLDIYHTATRDVYYDYNNEEHLF